MENKSCYNCKHFYQHYVMRKDKIRPIGCGHCLGRKIKVKELSKFPFEEGCELWADNKAKVEERKEFLTDMLKAMAEQIHHIELMLKEYERISSQ